jgi:hypothetical protein
VQDESYLAFLDTMIVLPWPRRISVPVLGLGAERDTIFTVNEVRRTARAYRTEAEIFSGLATHDARHGLTKVADRVDAWVRTTPALAG